MKRRPGQPPDVSVETPARPEPQSYKLRSIPTLKENGGMMYPFTVW